MAGIGGKNTIKRSASDFATYARTRVAKKSRGEECKTAKPKAAPKREDPRAARGASKWKLDEFYSWSVETQTSKLPFCLADGISLSQFEKMIEYREKTGRSSQTGGCFKWEFKEGKAWIYELPHLCHEEAAGKLAQELLLGLGAHSRAVSNPPSPRMANSNGALSAEPDNSIRVVGGPRPGPASPDRSDAQGNRFSNIVFEVAYNESERHVRLKALSWLQTSPTQPDLGVQQVVVIKIGTVLRASGHRTMRALRYARGALNNPVQNIEFGHDGVNGGATVAGLANMQVNVPTASIFVPLNVPAPLPQPPGGSIPIDLFYIRQVIEAAF